MKKKSIIFLSCLLAGMVCFNTACENEELSPYVEPLPGVHAFAQFAEDSPQSFVFGQSEEDVTFDIRWISIDSQLEVNKIDLYVLFNENYEDEDGNPLVARHGGTEGRLFRTIEGSEIPSNREPIQFSVSQPEVFNLYEGITFDYDQDGNAEPVFDNDFKPGRTDNTPFVAGDNFTVRWVLYTTDGLVFDSWSPSVCTELPGANCQVTWQLICESDLAGTYTYRSVGVTDGQGPFDYTGTETFEQVGDGKYRIADLSGQMEPLKWDNPPVEAVLIDACGSISLDESTFSYLYGYTITSGSVDAETGVITINWSNVYNEGGQTVYTPAD